MLVAVVGLFAMSAAAAPVFSTAAKLQDYVGPLAGCVTPSPDGAHVYVASEDADAIAIFERAPDTGFLTFLGAVRDGMDGVTGLDGARTLALSTDGASTSSPAPACTRSTVSLRPASSRWPTSFGSPVRASVGRSAATVHGSMRLLGKALATATTRGPGTR